MELLGKRCHRLALLIPGANQAHPAAPASAVQRSLPSLSQCHPCCTCQCHCCPCRAPSPGWLSLCLLISCFLREGDANRALDVPHVTLAREGSTCRVPVQSQQHPGKLGGGSEPGPSLQYGQHCEKHCHILRSPKEAKSASQSLQLMPSSAAPGMCQLETWLLVTAELVLLPQPSGSQLQGVSENWSFVGEERDDKRGNTKTSDSPKHGGRCLATPLGALGGIEKAKRLQENGQMFRQKQQGHLAQSCCIAT